MRFYWVRDRIQQNHFHIFWEERKKNFANYVTKYHPIWHYIPMRPVYVKATKKDTENQKYRENGTRRGCYKTKKPSEYVNRIIPLRESVI